MYIWIFIILLILYLFIYQKCNDINFVQIDSKIRGPHILFVGGTHGNEPSGTVGLEQLQQFFSINLKLKKGKITIISRMNPCGLLLNCRSLPHRFINNDLNRNYPKKYGENPLDKISEKVIKIVDGHDWIIDFHEGWDFHLRNKNSLGSGIYPNKTELSYLMANKIKDDLNLSITDSSKKFITKRNIDTELKTLQNYCNLVTKNHILVEITGQNDIQPMELRSSQVLSVCGTVLKQLHMI
jgi:hypothetical protein